jgi:hypothetical protein
MNNKETNSVNDLNVYTTPTKWEKPELIKTSFENTEVGKYKGVGESSFYSS